jgi:hypothetical protein
MVYLGGLHPTPRAAENPHPDPLRPTVPRLERSRPVPTVGGAIVFHEHSKLPLPEGYRLLVEEPFEDPSALGQFALSDPKAWKMSEERSGFALELSRQSEYEPVVRSPVNLALLADQMFADFILEADLLQTGREYGHRDMCLFFGFQNPTNFYYVHLATAADDNAHNIFLVKNAPRTKIGRALTSGVNWGLEVWHHVRLERRVAEGSIRVFFDDLSKPVLVAEDTTFGAGYIGFGSFDDTGKVDKIRIWGPAVTIKPIPCFRRPD